MADTLIPYMHVVDPNHSPRERVRAFLDELRRDPQVAGALQLAGMLGEMTGGEMDGDRLLGHLTKLENSTSAEVVELVERLRGELKRFIDAPVFEG